MAHPSYIRNLLSLTALVAALGLFPGASQAQEGVANPLDKMGFDQRLDQTVPLDLSFVDDQGTAVRLGDYFSSGRPVILTMGYYECPTLCSVVRSGLAQSLSAISLDVGRDFAVVSVSIDPDETPMVAQSTKTLVTQRYARPGTEPGWHFLTGDQEAISQLAAAIGFRYYYDEKIAQYGHPSGIVMLTERGKIARYFYGIDYPATDLRLGLVETSEGKIGNPIDQFMLFCYQYDPVTARYTGLVMNMIRAGGIAIVLTVGGGLLIARQLGRRKDLAISHEQRTE
jgi:protein SCO1/2